MSATTQTTITISRSDLEEVIQRIVQEAVREELTRMLRTPSRTILDYWEHEGADDPAGDEELLHEALAIIERYEKDPSGWKTLEEFEAEITQAEAPYALSS